MNPQNSEFFDVANSKFIILTSGSEGNVDANFNYGTFESDTTITIFNPAIDSDPETGVDS